MNRAGANAPVLAISTYYEGVRFLTDGYNSTGDMQTLAELYAKVYARYQVHKEDYEHGIAVQMQGYFCRSVLGDIPL